MDKMIQNSSSYKCRLRKGLKYQMRFALEKNLRTELWGDTVLLQISYLLRICFQRAIDIEQLFLIFTFLLEQSAKIQVSYCYFGKNSMFASIMCTDTRHYDNSFSGLEKLWILNAASCSLALSD